MHLHLIRLVAAVLVVLTACSPQAAAPAPTAAPAQSVPKAAEAKPTEAAKPAAPAAQPAATTAPAKPTVAAAAKPTEATKPAAEAKPAGPARLTDGKIVFGVINDQSGVYAELGGQNVVKAVQMAIDDFEAKYGKN